MKKYYSLILPIWLLYNAKSIDQIELNIEKAKIFKAQHSLEQRLKLHRELQEIEAHHDYNFVEFTKTFPKRKKIGFPNNEIYEYLMSFKSFMENKEFGLLTDNKPTKEY